MVVNHTVWAKLDIHFTTCFWFWNLRFTSFGRKLDETCLGKDTSQNASEVRLPGASRQRSVKRLLRRRLSLRRERNLETTVAGAPLGFWSFASNGMMYFLLLDWSSVSLARMQRMLLSPLAGSRDRVDVRAYHLLTRTPSSAPQQIAVSPVAQQHPTSVEAFLSLLVLCLLLFKIPGFY